MIFNFGEAELLKTIFCQLRSKLKSARQRSWEASGTMIDMKENFTTEIRDAKLSFAVLRQWNTSVQSERI